MEPPRAHTVAPNGIVERLADESVSILVDEYLPEGAQIQLLGRAVSQLTVPARRSIFRPPNGATNCLHVRALDPYAYNTLAFEAEDPPMIDYVSSRGLLLRTVWFDTGGPDARCFLLLVPWDQVLGFSVLLWAADERADGGRRVESATE